MVHSQLVNSRTHYTKHHTKCGCLEDNEYVDISCSSSRNCTKSGDMRVSDCTHY